ncbi:XdhC family protein [Jejubacter calystegiae]|uniref:XdhC family protein n=1 Tax=Jejubacter calystegiae TaxID=2579935 RepID=A0A4P8YLA6_9ENTR|nr:XdhC family protein [Jejubacter calystegiae]QCT20424.1 XdhC family protein [Jejubacter calystegiae]
MTQPIDIDILNSAIHWLKQGQPVWLCTVIATWGSAPRSPGAMMAVNENGEFTGSLSGGCIEQSFLAGLNDPRMKRPSQLIRYGQGGQEPDVTLPCNGSLSVLVEYLPPDNQSLQDCQRLLLTLSGQENYIKRLIPGERAWLVPASGDEAAGVTQHESGALSLNLRPPLQLIVCGLSPVACYCIDFARAVGMAITVCEHREDMRQSFASRYPDAEQQNIELCQEFPAAWLERHPPGPNSALLSLTHDPRIDDLAMMEAVQGESFYIGVMGSARNSQHRMARLRDTGGLSDAQIARIRAPVGLDIGSKTPAEIAIAIVADIIASRNSKTPR